MQNFSSFKLKPTVSEKYDMYVSSHPKCKKMSKAEVARLMFAEKLISTVEMLELQNPIFSKKTDANKAFGYKAMGLDLMQPSNKTHPVFSHLQMVDDKSNKVDLSKYTLNGLKATYDSKTYNVVQGKDGKITVSLKNGTPVLDVLDYTETQKMLTFYEKGKPVHEISLLKNSATVDMAKLLTHENGVKIEKIYSGECNFPDSKNETFRNGDKKYSRYDKNGKLSYEGYCKSGDLSVSRFVLYTNGKPYKKQNGYEDKNPQYILVNDLKDDIYAKTKLGLPTTRKSISENVLKRITSDNILETLEQYEKLTGNELIQDIKDEIGLDSILKNKLVNHIESLYVKQSSSKDGGKWLAQRLFDDIQGLGSGDLAQHVKMIDSGNLKYVLTEYRRLTKENNEKNSNNIYKFLDVLRDIPGVKIDYKTSDNLAQILAPIEGLLTAIADEWGLKEKDRANLINKIIDVSMEDASKATQSRIRGDINSHPKDYHKVEVDLYRAQNSIGGDMRNFGVHDSSDVKNNKTFSGQIKQGQTGDCWLLAGLNSISAKPEMLKELEKKVSIDPKTGDYLVTLKVDVPKIGLKDKVFRVTKNDLNSYTNLATGSEKVNAVEIAMDKLIRDDAYESRKNRDFDIDEEFGYVDKVTLDANYSKFLWQSLFGWNFDLFNIEVDPAKEDFNKPDRVYEVSFGGDAQETFSGLASSEKKKNCELHSRHAYSIIGSDEKNIYLLNPWDSKDKITISREDFQKLPTDIEFYEIPKT